MFGMDAIQRGVLPIPDRQHIGLVTYDAKDPDTSFPPIEPLRPPAGAPNVLVVLIDDCGFGASSAFGGPCATPIAARLADRRDARAAKDFGRSDAIRDELAAAGVEVMDGDSLGWDWKIAAV